MYKIKFVAKFIGYIIYRVFPMPSIFHRCVNKWIFASHIGWNGSSNSKSLLVQLKDNELSVNAIWIAQNREEEKLVRSAGFRCYVWNSLKGMYHCLTAGVYIFTDQISDINRLTARTAFCVNLWHGVGIKKMFGMDANYYRHYFGFKREPAPNSFLDRMKVILHTYKKPDTLLVTSRYQSEYLFAPTYQISMEKIVLADYPRNELLLWPQEKIRSYVERYGVSEDLTFIDKLSNHSYRKIYIYMPTWRIGYTDSILSMAGFDLLALEKALAETNSLFIMKPHKGDRWELGNTQHIVCFQDLHEIYTILPYTDCLITDYSSIYCDYILMNKEIILFPFDKEEYMSNSHDTLDYDTHYLGKKVYSFEDLIILIREEVDCHLSSEEQETVLRIYQECHGNGLDLIQEIQKRYHNFLRKRKK